MNMIQDKNIHLLSLSIDRSIFIKGSAVRARMERFGSLVGGTDIIVLGAPDSRTEVLANNVTVHGASGKPKLLAAMKALLLARKLARENTIIVTQDAFELGFIGLIASWLTHRPLNVQVHIDFFSPYFRAESMRQRFQAAIAPFVLRRAGSVRVVSEKIATHLRDSLGIAASKIVIAPVFVDVEEAKNKTATVDLRAKYPQFDWIVLVACRYVKQKDVPLAIEAFEILKKTAPKAGMIIAGSGPEESEIKAIVAENGLSGSVIVGSWTKEFASCMKTSDVFLLSSDYEGWAMTVIEAAALTKPIVMTDVGCAGEFLINEKNGLVVPVRDSVTMAAALVRLYSNRAFGLNMGQEAKRSADTYMTREESDTLMLQSWKSAL